MLCVRDLERSRRFYVESLGASVISANRQIIVLRLAGTVLYLFTDSPPTPDKPSIHLAPPSRAGRPSIVIVLRVDDASAAYREFVGRGVTFLSPPVEPPWGGLRCFACDPDGYVVELEQPPRA